MSSLAGRAFGGAVTTLFWQGARTVVLLGSIIVLGRLLAPADFGLLVMVTSVIGIGELLRDFGLSVASLQARTLTDDERSNLFWINTLTGLGLTAAAFSAAWPVALLYGEDRLVPITQALSVTFLINGLATQFKAQLNRDLRFMALGGAEVVAQAVGVGTAIAVALVAPTPWALVTQLLVAGTLEALLAVSLARWRPGRYRRDVPIGRFVRFAGALVGTQALAYCTKNVDSVLLGVLRGPVVLGAYNRAFQVMSLPLAQLTVPLSRVAIPVLSKLQDAPPAFLRFLTTAQFATVTVTSVLYGSMIGLGEPLVRQVLGGQWLAAVPILQLLAVAGLFRVLGQVPYWTFVSLGRTRQQFAVHLVGQPLIVAAIAVGTQYGGVGVAAGCAVGYAVFWVLNLGWAGRVTGLPLGRLAWSGLALVAVFAGPVALLGTLAVRWFGDGWTALVVGGAWVLVWVAAALVLVPRHRAELGRFLRLAREHRADPSRPGPGRPARELTRSAADVRKARGR